VSSDSPPPPQPLPHTPDQPLTPLERACLRNGEMMEGGGRRMTKYAIKTTNMNN
jgi:hypothetical protein